LVSSAKYGNCCCHGLFPVKQRTEKSVFSVAKQIAYQARITHTFARHLRYKGAVEGNPNDRELAIHQGAVWPWLIQFFVEGYLKIHKKGGLPFVKQIMEDFEDDMTEHCIGTMSEMYNGNPPHRAKGQFRRPGVWPVWFMQPTWYRIIKNKTLIMKC
jgi:hypothetical protein